MVRTIIRTYYIGPVCLVFSQHFSIKSEMIILADQKLPMGLDNPLLFLVSL